MTPPDELRARLSLARLMLIFTPAACPPGKDPLEVLEAVLSEVDVVQVRVKPVGDSSGVSPARELHDCTTRVLALVAACPGPAPLVLVNDRVDVALCLAARGAAGVHLGQDDCPVAGAREILGPGALIGLSTHGTAQVAAAEELPADYLGFGPIFPTRTKGYVRGLGPDAAWVADAASARPLFPIGGIDPTNAAELGQVGRAAVSSAILSAPDPGEAARVLRLLVAGERN